MQGEPTVVATTMRHLWSVLVEARAAALGGRRPPLRRKPIRILQLRPLHVILAAALRPRHDLEVVRRAEPEELPHPGRLVARPGQRAARLVLNAQSRAVSVVRAGAVELGVVLKVLLRTPQANNCRPRTNVSPECSALGMVGKGRRGNVQACLVDSEEVDVVVPEQLEVLLLDPGGALRERRRQRRVP